MDYNAISKRITSKDFAKAVKESDNYYIIITREDLHILPYSVNEIYGIQKIGKTITNEPTYNALYRLYGDIAANTVIMPTLLITEDSNSGFDFFKTVCDSNGVKCISAKGKNEIVKYIYNRPEENILVPKYSKTGSLGTFYKSKGNMEKVLGKLENIKLCK